MKLNSTIKIVLLTLCFMLSHHALADTYDPLLLRAQASIFPKIILLDQDLARKSIANKVVITIVSTSQDFDIAIQLRKSIAAKYGDTLGNNELSIEITSFDDFNKKDLSTAYILLQGSKLLFENVVSHASSHNRIVFSYSYTDFRYDSLISLYLKEKAYIYVNRSTVQKYGISFLPVFYKIIKII